LPWDVYLTPSLFGASENELKVKKVRGLFRGNYTDEFQRKNSLRALKQKGIENYDRAITSCWNVSDWTQAILLIDHEELAKA